MRYTIEGVTDERDSCDCCGKTGLKRTVVLADSDGEFVFFGTTCAARAMRVQVREVRAGIRNAAARQREADRRLVVERDRKRSARWVAHLIARTGGLSDYAGAPDVFGMIEACGGYAAARVGFSHLD